MRPVTDLCKLSDAVAARLIKLRRLYAAAISVNEPRRAELLAVGVIELDNAVLSALRVLTISSLRSARTKGGARVVTSRKFGDEGEIGAFVLSVLDQAKFSRLRSPVKISRREEPTVRDPRDTAKILTAANASNLTSFQNALALNTKLFGDLGTIRNFYAHRNQDTWRKALSKAQAMGIFSAGHADDIITAGLPGRPVSVFEDWIDDADLFFDEATK